MNTRSLLLICVISGYLNLVKSIAIKDTHLENSNGYLEQNVGRALDIPKQRPKLFSLLFLTLRGMRTLTRYVLDTYDFLFPEVEFGRCMLKNSNFLEDYQEMESQMRQFFNINRIFQLLQSIYGYLRNLLLNLVNLNRAAELYEQQRIQKLLSEMQNGDSNTKNVQQKIHQKQLVTAVRRSDPVVLTIRPRQLQDSPAESEPSNENYESEESTTRCFEKYRSHLLWRFINFVVS